MRQSRFIEELIDRTRMFRCKILAPGVSPTIIRGTGNVEWARRDERHQHVLIHGQGVFSVLVLVMIGTKPIANWSDHMVNPFTVTTSVKCRSATTGIVADDHGESSVLRARPKSCFAES